MSWLTRQRSPQEMQVIQNAINQGINLSEVYRGRREKEKKEESLKNFMSLVGQGETFENAVQQSGVDPINAQKVMNNFMQFKSLQEQQAQNNQIRTLTDRMAGMDVNSPEYGNLFRETQALKGEPVSPWKLEQQEMARQEHRQRMTSVPMWKKTKTGDLRSVTVRPNEVSNLLMDGWQRGKVNLAKPKTILDSLKEDKARNEIKLIQKKIANQGQPSPTDMFKLRQNITGQINKLYGYNEFNKFDDKTAKKVQDTIVKAVDYTTKDGMDYTKAIRDAYLENNPEPPPEIKKPGFWKGFFEEEPKIDTEEVRRPMPTTVLPKGLTEAHIQTYEKQGLTREQVIEAYKKKHGIR